MRSLFTFVMLVSAVLVPWSSLAPVLLPDASGSSIGPGAAKSHKLAVRLNPALGILPILARDEDSKSPADASVAAAQNPAAETPHLRMICENGVCRLVPDADTLGAAASAHECSKLDANRRKLEELGATQIRVESDTEGQWRCCCSVPVSLGSKVMRRFEAAGDSDEQAMQAACKSVETWLRSHR
jgi:hypothetical protein